MGLVDEDDSEPTRGGRDGAQGGVELVSHAQKAANIAQEELMASLPVDGLDEDDDDGLEADGGRGGDFAG